MSGLTSEEREALFWAKVDKSGDCWLWMAAKDEKGYGRFTPAPGKGMAAHRWIYERTVGPIPVGYTIDHLCRVHGCVRPDHLEPVTRKENVLRGFGFTANQARQSTCYRGHQLDGKGKRRDGRTYRYCLTCKRTKQAQRRQALRGDS